MRVYADNAATTRVSKTALEAMLPYFTEIYGNPSSLHSFGQDAKEALENAREHIAAVLGTAGFAENCHRTVFNGYNRFDAQQRTGHGCSRRNTAAFFQIFQCVNQSDQTEFLLHFIEE